MNLMNKGKVLHLIIGFMLCISLCGCEVTIQPEQSVESPEGVASQNESDDLFSAEAEDGDVADTDKDVDAETDADAPESVYQQLLEGICEMIRTKEFWTDTKLVCEAGNGVSEAQYSGLFEELSKCVGYTLQDINADGMPELIVCAINEEEDGEYRGRDICAVYTCVQEEIYCICSGWSRNYVGWMGDNEFCCLGSGGASSSLAGQYVLLPDATEWSCKDLYFTDENDIYHNQTGAFETEYSEVSDMTEDEFWELWDELEENVLEFKLTPFSTFAVTGGLQLPEQNKDAEVEIHWADDVLSERDDYDEYIAYTGDFSSRIAFTTTGSVKEFKVLELQFEAIDDEGNIQFTSEKLFNYGTLTADRALMVEMIFEGSIPGYGISYVDAGGNTRMFSIELSGMDGSLSLQEFTQAQ